MPFYYFFFFFFLLFQIYFFRQTSEETNFRSELASVSSKMNCQIFHNLWSTHNLQYIHKAKKLQKSSKFNCLLEALIYILGLGKNQKAFNIGSWWLLLQALLVWGFFGFFSLAMIGLNSKIWTITKDIKCKRRFSDNFLHVLELCKVLASLILHKWNRTSYLVWKTLHKSCLISHQMT